MRPSRMLGTFFGSGLSPVMPGTCGSILAAACIVAIPGEAYGWVTGILALAATLIGPRCADAMIRSSSTKDPQSFVLDEAAGLWIAAFRPTAPGWPTVLVALLAFRLFDIVKPWPIRKIERLPGGYGVVYDDVFAGLAALGVSVAFQAAFL